MRLSRLWLIVAAVVMLSGVWAAFAQDSSYTVQPGDMLDSIAAQFDVQMDCLAKANNLDKPSQLKPGQVLTIDLSCPHYDGLDFVTSPREDAGQGGGGGSLESGDVTYTVQAGDVLDLIAAEFDVQAKCIAEANNLKNPGRITPGQELTIKADCPRYDGEAFVPNPRGG